MRGAGTFVAMAITTVIVSGLLPLPPLRAQIVEIPRDGDSTALVYKNGLTVSSFRKRARKIISRRHPLPTLNSLAIPKPAPTPTPTPAPTPAPMRTPTPTPNIVTLAWNSSSDTTVVGYRLYMGTESQNYVATMTLGNQTSVKVFIKAPATYFVVTAYNIDGLESSPSGEVVVIK
jgi:hypothetical protein